MQERLLSRQGSLMSTAKPMKSRVRMSFLSCDFPAQIHWGISEGLWGQNCASACARASPLREEFLTQGVLQAGQCMLLLLTS